MIDHLLFFLKPQVKDSGRKSSEFFQLIPANFLSFPAGTGRKLSENFRTEYCFHVPAISGVFSSEPALTS
jgi:hypothetical protein